MRIDDRKLFSPYLVFLFPLFINTPKLAEANPLHRGICRMLTGTFKYTLSRHESPCTANWGDDISATLIRDVSCYIRYSNQNRVTNVTSVTKRQREKKKKAVVRMEPKKRTSNYIRHISMYVNQLYQPSHTLPSLLLRYTGQLETQNKHCC